MTPAPKTMPDILCIGAVLWDIIGRTPATMTQGEDVPGRITRLPGGVAMNIAMTLGPFGLRPAVLSAIGRDQEGDDLIAAVAELGIGTEFVHRSANRPTDRYMAIEGANGLIAAIADAHSLEAAGDAILTPLADGRLGSIDAPWSGPVALDGNLTTALMAQIATSPLFAKADLRVAPASPGKADRLGPFLAHPSATLYLNLIEARTLGAKNYADAPTAAADLAAQGARRVCVTDGGRPCAAALNGEFLALVPPPVGVVRVTGAGDTFMAGHIAAERQGLTGEAALRRAIVAAATYISGETPA